MRALMRWRRRACRCKRAGAQFAAIVNGRDRIVRADGACATSSPMSPASASAMPTTRKLGSGVTAIVFDEPAVAASTCAAAGPARARPRCSIRRRPSSGIDAIALSGGSAFGLDAASGVQAWLREQGRGFAVGDARVPIVPGAILFDLLNGGDKNWGRFPPYRELGYDGGRSRRRGLRARQRRRRASARPPPISRAASARPRRMTRDGVTVGALAAVNAAGSVDDRRRPAFLGGAVRAGRRIRRPRLAGASSAGRARPSRQRRAPARTPRSRWSRPTRALTKAQAKRLAVMAQDGLARAIYPVHTPLDGDIVFAAATGKQAAAPIRSTASPSSARSPPTCSRARSRAASTRRRRCPSPARCRLARQVRQLGTPSTSSRASAASRS